MYIRNNSLAVDALEGIIDGGVVVTITDDTLVVHTQDDMRREVLVCFFLTSRIGLISDQRRLGGEDTHIIDDKVVSVPVGRHVVDSYAEVFVVDILVKDDREIDLAPLTRGLDTSRGIRGDIHPIGSVDRSLHTKGEVRVRFTGLATGVANIAGEEHLLSGAQMRLQREGSYLTGRRHTVAVDHVSVGSSSVLLHRTPIGRHTVPPMTCCRNAVDQSVLTMVREVGMDVQSVVGQVGRLRIRVAVRSIRPRQRVRIDRIFGSRLVVVEIQAFQHFVVLLDIIVGDQGFDITCLVFRLRQRTVLAGLVVYQLIAADIEHICAIHGGVIACFIRQCTLTLRAQTIIDGIEFLSIGDVLLRRHFQEVVAHGCRVVADGVFLGLGVVGVPLAGSIPTAAPDHRVLAGSIPCRNGLVPVIVAHIVT